MSRFTCWPEGGESEAAVVEANSVRNAALRFVKEVFVSDLPNDTEGVTVIVSDEKARRFQVAVVATIEYSALAPKELSAADIFPDDPMPTPEAERLRDEMAGGAK